MLVIEKGSEAKRLMFNFAVHNATRLYRIKVNNYINPKQFICCSSFFILKNILNLFYCKYVYLF